MCAVDILNSRYILYIYLSISQVGKFKVKPITQTHTGTHVANEQRRTFIYLYENKPKPKPTTRHGRARASEMEV